MSKFNFIYAEDLSHREKTVYIYLRDRADASGVCWPGIKTIAGELGLSPRTVQRALADLEHRQLIEKRQRHRANGSAERHARSDQEAAARCPCFHVHMIPPFGFLPHAVPSMIASPAARGSLAQEASNDIPSHGGTRRFFLPIHWVFSLPTPWNWHFSERRPCAHARNSPHISLK